MKKLIEKGLSFKQQISLLRLFVVFLFITLFVLLAIPSFRDLVKDNYTEVVARHFTDTLALARNEAMERERSVTVCAIDPSLEEQCQVVGEYEPTKSWNNGWLIFVDKNNNGIRDDAEEDIIHTNHALTDNTVISSSTPSITYTRTGSLGSQESTVTIKPMNNCAGSNVQVLKVKHGGGVTHNRAGCL